MHIWVHIWARAIWSSGVSLKRSCKMQFRRIGLRSIGPNQIFGRFPHCNYNVKLKIAGKMSFWVYNAEIFSGGSYNLRKPLGLILYQNSNFWCFWTPTLLKIYVRSTLWLHPAIGCALGNANSHYWHIFGVRLQRVSWDLSLTGPAVCAGIFRLSISKGKQFSTDY